MPGSPLAGGRKVGNVSQLPANTAGTLTDPKTGDPAVIVHTSGSNFYAYDAVCSHAGYTVQYDSQQRLLVCPCHGGTFDPAHGAQVVADPPPTPLAPLEMKIDAEGNIYLV
ncbi:MAG: Rieske (2Fe-2S) protein [Chloroflexota bacterium]|nr:Rieske (2Fe-2S) protein [Chloroflexota bacterium]